MPEPGLDLAQADTSLEEVRRPGVTQRMDGGVLVNASILDRRAKGALHAILKHGLGRGGDRPSRAVEGREQPDGVAMGAPVGAQQQQRALGQRHIAILVAFAALDVQQHTSAIDLRYGQGDAFHQAQPAGIDDAQTDTVAGTLDAGQNSLDFLNTEHGRQLVLGGWTQEVKGRPRPLKGALKQELDRTERDGYGAAGGVALVAQKEEILTQLVLGDVVRSFAEMEGLVGGLRRGRSAAFWRTGRATA